MIDNNIFCIFCLTLTFLNLMSRFLQKTFVYECPTWNLYYSLDLSQHCKKVLLQSIPNDQVILDNLLTFQKSEQNFTPNFLIMQEQMTLLYDFPTLGMFTMQASGLAQKQFSYLTLIDYSFQILSVFQFQCMSFVRFSYNYKTMCFNKLTDYRGQLQPIFEFEDKCDIKLFLKQLVCNKEDSSQYDKCKLLYNDKLISLLESVNSENINELLVDDLYQKNYGAKESIILFITKGIITNKFNPYRFIKQIE